MARLFDVDLLESILVYIYVLMSVVGDENIIAIGPVVVLVEYATPNYNNK